MVERRSSRLRAASRAGGLEDWIEVHRTGEVSVSIGSVQMLLAMKLLANRGIRDSADIEFLLEACNVRSLDDAQTTYEKYHAQEVLSPSAAARVQHWLARNSRR
jgi:hypothetical protein